MTKTFNEPVEFEAEVRHKILPHVFVDKLKPGSATPPVSNVTAFNAGGVLVTITNFTKGAEGQEIHILGDGLTTVAQNANIKRRNAISEVLLTDVIYHFMLFQNIWYETPGDFASAEIIVDFMFDAGTAVLAAGYAGELGVPKGTIKDITLIADAALGTFVLDVWVDTYANVPLNVADTITAAAKPSMTDVRKFRDTTLTGWNKVIPADAFMGFNIDSVTLYKRVTGRIVIKGAI